MAAKPHRLTSLEDRVEVGLGDWTRILIIKGIREKPVPKKLAPELYQDLSPPRPRLDPVDRVMKQSLETREPGKGRPTKKERRLIGRLKGH
jgi:ribosome-associated heat shock protein Hsp15